MFSKTTRSLRIHLVILNLLVLAPLLISGLIIAAMYVASERQALVSQAQDVLRNVRFSVNKELQRYALSLDGLTKSARLDQGAFEELYKSAQILTETIPGSRISLEKAGGEPIFNTFRQFGSNLPSRTAPSLLAAEEAAIRTRQLVFSNVWEGNLTQGLWIGLVRPIVDGPAVAYLLILAVPAQSIAEIVQAQNQSKKWLFGVVGTDQRIIARTWEPERFVGQKASEQFTREAQGSHGSFFNTTLEGARVFNVYERSALTGWVFASAVPAQEFEAPIRRSAILLLGVLATGLLVAVLLSYVYGKRLLHPAEKLLETASEQPNNQPLATGIKEFDFLASKLRASFSTLTQREKEKSLLIDELNHRGRNMLATIQAIAFQSGRYAYSLKEFEQSFNARLLALANSYHLLTKSNWQPVELAELVSACCRPFISSGKFQVSGPSVMLQPSCVAGMGMLLHELATNATKCGPLKQEGGWVSVQWRVAKFEDRNAIKFEWKEHCTQPLTSETPKRGFGSELITTIVERDFRSKPEKRLDPDGLYFSMCILDESAEFAVSSGEQELADSEGSSLTKLAS